MKLSSLLLLLVSCSWPRGFLFVDSPIQTAFSTACGLRILEPLPTGWTPEATNALETRAVAAYAALGGRFADPCADLDDWEVQVVNQKNFVGSSGDLVGGETSCAQRRIIVDNSAPAAGRLAHELGHALQSCDPAGDGRTYLDQHFGWAPIYAALRNAGLPE